MWKWIVIASFVVVGIVLYAAVEVDPEYPPSPVTGPIKTAVQDFTAFSEQVQLGKQLYETLCFTCHGLNGDGVPITPEALNTQIGDRIYARDFTGKTHMDQKVVFKYTWGGFAGEFASDEELKYIIRHGLYGTPMPGFDYLSERELDALIAYIKTFNDGWKNYEPTPPPDVKVPYDLLSQERIDRGRELFLERCIACHQDQENGGEPVPQPTQWYVPGTDSLMMITSRNFLTEPLRFPEPENVYRTIKMGIGGTTMNPALWADFTDDQIWDLVSYVYYLRNKGRSKSNETVASN